MTISNLPNTTDLEDDKRRRRAIGEVILHLAVWTYIFVTPLFFGRDHEAFDWAHYFRGLLYPMGMCVLFYLNYLYLVPQYFEPKRHWRFVLINLMAIAAIVGLHSLCFTHLPPLSPPHHHHHHIERPMMLFGLPFFMISKMLSHLFIVAIAIMLRLSKRWWQSEMALQRAERRRAEAEVSNLKNQLNPHFLLNTLNNIYALVAFDTEQAQHAIEELSKLLRYMLYEDITSEVEVQQEAEFLRHYIALMSLRQTAQVQVTFDTDIPADCKVKVAPLIFISLVENAFKHGVSPCQPSHLHITFAVDEAAGTVRFLCTNPNHPKSSADKSPGGIGLNLVASRLALAYPDRHTWHYGVDSDGIYRSDIRIRLH